MKISTTHQDIQEVTKQIKLLLPHVVVKQLTVTHDTDDDGIWWFSLPGVDHDIQIESSSGACPFLIETDEQSSGDALRGSTVDETSKLVVEYLRAASDGHSIKLQGERF